MDINSNLLTPEEAALYMGIQPKTLATWRSTKRYGLRYVKLGRSVRYRLEDLEKFITEGLNGSHNNGGTDND